MLSRVSKVLLSSCQSLLCSLPDSVWQTSMPTTTLVRMSTLREKWLCLMPSCRVCHCQPPSSTKSSHMMTCNHLTGTMLGSTSCLKTWTEEDSNMITWLFSTTCTPTTTMELGTRMRTWTTNCQILMMVCIRSTRDPLSSCSSWDQSFLDLLLDTQLSAWKCHKRIILFSTERSTEPPEQSSKCNNWPWLSMEERWIRCKTQTWCTLRLVSTKWALVLE